MSILRKIFGQTETAEYRLRDLTHTLKNYDLELNQLGIDMALRLQDEGANYYELVGLMISHCMATDLTEMSDKKIDVALGMARSIAHYSLAKAILRKISSSQLNTMTI